MKTTSHKTAVKAAVLLAIGAAAMTAAGCASQPKDLQNQTTISWKGSQHGTKIPNWVLAAEESNAQLKKLPEYADVYCFVGQARSTNLNFAERWAQQFDAQQQISTFLRSSVSTIMSAKERGEDFTNGAGTASRNVSSAASAESSELTRKIDDALSQSTVADFTGSQREADFWEYVRTYDPDDRKKYTDVYVAYVLYTLPIDKMENQIKAYIDDVKERVPESGQIADGIKAELASHNLDWIAISEAVAAKQAAQESVTP